MEAIAAAGLRLAADPLGGSSVSIWSRVAETYRLSVEIVNPRLDPTFAFMPLDHDGRIRMDCSSPWRCAISSRLKDRFGRRVRKRSDADRHGIVTRSCGLLNPNHYLAVAVDYLFGHRPGWPERAGACKTLVSSSMPRPCSGRPPEGAARGPGRFQVVRRRAPLELAGFCGRGECGASFLRRMAPCGPPIRTASFSACSRRRSQRSQAGILGSSTSTLKSASVDPPTSGSTPRPTRPRRGHSRPCRRPASPPPSLRASRSGPASTRAPGNDAPIGGLKVVTENGWFAARPSGTEDIYKIYAESFRGPDHLTRIQEEAQALVATALAATMC